MRKREIIAWVKRYGENPVKPPVLDCAATSGTPWLDCAATSRTPWLDCAATSGTPWLDCAATSGTPSQRRNYRRWEEEYRIGEDAMAKNETPAEAQHTPGPFVVRCNECMMMFHPDDLGTRDDCPSCGYNGGLFDMTAETVIHQNNAVL